MDKKCAIGTLVLWVLFAGLFVRQSRAENSSHDSKACTGLIYKSKKDNVAVYQEADLTAQVLTRLSIGEEVCSIGEEKGFAIVDWQATEKKARGKKGEGKDLVGKNTLVFVRIVDLWQKTNNSSGSLGVFGRITRYVKYILYGGVPEDPLMPYRPVLDSFPARESQSSSSMGNFRK